MTHFDGSRLNCVTAFAAATLLAAVVAPPEIRHPSGSLDRTWSLRGPWSGVASDDTKHVIYALGPHGGCVELDESGTVAREFKLPGASGDILRLARFQAGKDSALLTFHVWREQVKAYDATGKALWTYPEARTQAIDDVWASDLDGDGRDEVIVGFNAGTGLHVLDHRGKLVWKSTDIGDVWHVCAGPVLGDGHMQIVTTDGGGIVHLFGADGTPLKDLNVGCHVHMVRTTGSPGKTGSAQILGTCGDGARKQSLRAIAGDGTPTWELALPEDAQPEIVSAAVTPDGRLAAFGTGAGIVYVVDIERGTRFASVDFQGHFPQVAWSGDQHVDSPLLLVATGSELNAFRVVP
jgi:outer membrane protein assembly factor BamB